VIHYQGNSFTIHTLARMPAYIFKEIDKCYLIITLGRQLFQHSEVSTEYKITIIVKEYAACNHNHSDAKTSVVSIPCIVYVCVCVSRYRKAQTCIIYILFKKNVNINCYSFINID
jgi:hypothetical protein